MDIVVIIPSYNPPNTLKKLIADLKTIEMVSKIIVVDDGSDKKLAIDGHDVILLKHDKNLGKGAAIRSALKFLKNMHYDYVAFLDSDLVVDKSDLINFLNLSIMLKNDITIGYPVNVNKKGFGLVKWFARFVIKVYTQSKVKNPLSGQRIVSRKAIESLRYIPDRYGIEVSTIIDFINKGFTVGEIPFNFCHDEKGKSFKHLLHKSKQMKDIFLVFIKKWQEMMRN